MAFGCIYYPVQHRSRASDWEWRTRVRVSNEANIFNPLLATIHWYFNRQLVTMQIRMAWSGRPKILGEGFNSLYTPAACAYLKVFEKFLSYLLSNLKLKCIKVGNCSCYTKFILFLILGQSNSISEFILKI